MARRDPAAATGHGGAAPKSPRARTHTAAPLAATVKPSPRITVLAALAAVGLLAAGCAGGNGSGTAKASGASDGSGASAAPGQATGLGASSALFTRQHAAARPGQAGTRYSTVVTDADGRVEGYVVTMSARPLSQAEALVRRDLPSDAAVGTPRFAVGIEGTACAIVRFDSPALRGLLGGAAGATVTAVFIAQNADSMDTGRIVQATVVSGNEGLPQRC